LILTLSDSFRKVLAAESLNQRFRIRDGKYKKLSRFAGVGNHDQILKGVLGFAEKSEDYSRELGCNRLGHGDWMGTCVSDFRSRDYEGRGQPSGFHRSTGDSVGCRDAGLLDSGTES
jgi:hypothetical protein